MPLHMLHVSVWRKDTLPDIRPSLVELTYWLLIQVLTVLDVVVQLTVSAKNVIESLVMFMACMFLPWNNFDMYV